MPSEPVINIAIDLGNSSAKIGVFVDGELKKQLVLLAQEELRELLEQYPKANVGVSAVGDLKSDWNKILKPHLPLFVDYKCLLPIQLDYDTPATLGADRIAAAAGAFDLFPESDCLIIDAGTCITIDLVDRSGVFRGGLIAPGIHMKFKALNTFTARLPLVQATDAPALTGKTTEQSIQSGVINGTLAEIREIIRMYSHKFADLRIVVTGGDSGVLIAGLSVDVVRADNLVLHGVNTILTYNAHS